MATPAMMNSPLRDFFGGASEGGVVGAAALVVIVRRGLSKAEARLYDANYGLNSWKRKDLGAWRGRRSDTAVGGPAGDGGLDVPTLSALGSKLWQKPKAESPEPKSQTFLKRQ